MLDARLRKIKEMLFLQKNGPINVDCHVYKILKLNKTYFNLTTIHSAQFSILATIKREKRERHNKMNS